MAMKAMSHSLTTDTIIDQVSRHEGVKFTATFAPWQGCPWAAPSWWLSVPRY